MINKKDHYKHQLKYFGDEFSEKTTYKLVPWQISYIDRIKKDLIDKNYKGKTLIDVATGSGYVAIEMAKLGLNVIAIDLTPQSVKNIEKYKKEMKLKNLRVIKSLAEKIDLKSNSVDFLVANAILEHIPNEDEAINEWKRIVKANGKMFITVPLRFRYIYPFLWIPNIFHDVKIGHLRRYNIQDFKNRFKLPVIRSYYTGHFVKIIGILISLITRSDLHEEYFEKMDKKKEKIPYGANNITVVLKNIKK